MKSEGEKGETARYFDHQKLLSYFGMQVRDLEGLPQWVSGGICLQCRRQRKHRFDPWFRTQPSPCLDAVTQTVPSAATETSCAWGFSTF